MMKVLLVVSLISFFHVSSFAENYYHDKDLSIPKNAKIKIIEFEQVAGGVFKGFVVGFDGEGPFYTRAEHLAKSIKPLTFKMVHKSPKKLVGKTFTLNEVLETVMPPPVEPIKNPK